MNAPAARGRWDRVEFWSSYFLLTVLACVIIMRLAFDGVWPVPTLDIWISAIALGLILLSPWIARRRAVVRVGIVAYAAATQLVPVTVRHPLVLLPILGALIPVAIAIWALVVLARKGRSPASHN